MLVHSRWPGAQLIQHCECPFKWNKKIHAALCFVWQQVDTTVLGLPKEEAEKKPYIPSMGVYIFKKEILLNLLRYAHSTYWILTSFIKKLNWFSKYF
jgi:ADP-glucose pyrophosphorylase